MTSLLDWSLKVSVILALALLTVALLRRQSAALRHWVLTVAIVCAALTPGLSLVIPNLNISVESDLGISEPSSPVVSPESFSSQNEFQTAPTAASAPLAPAISSVFAQKSVPSAEPTQHGAVLAPRVAERSTSAGTRTTLPVVMLLWLAGVLLMLLILSAGAIRLAWIGLRAREISSEAWLRIADEISRTYGLGRRVRLLECSRPTILATWGVIRPEILLPANAAMWPADRIHVVLSHELAHIARRDWLIQILGELVRAIYWFNPLAWIACRRLDLESEHACDDAVLNRGISGADYAAHLLALVRALHTGRSLPAPAQMMANKLTLKRRLKVMLDPGVRRSRSTRLSQISIAAAVVALALPVIALRVTAKPSTVLPSFKLTAPTSTAATTATGTVPLSQGIAQSAPLSLQVPELGVTTSVEGTIVRYGTNDPLSGIEVELTRVQGTDASPLSVSSATNTGRAPDVLPHVITSDDGKFAFRNLKPGMYTLVAADGAGSYTPAEYGQRSLQGRGIPFSIEEKQALLGVKLEMTPTGSISGRVTDENGEPIGGASVLALKFQYVNEIRRLTIAQTGYADDEGNYRLFWLPAGRYFIAANVENPEGRPASAVALPGTVTLNLRGTAPILTHRILPSGETVDETYVTVYYGSTLDAEQARAVDLKPGAEYAGVDIGMGIGKLRTHHIRGVAIVDGTASAAAVSSAAGVSGPSAGALIRAFPTKLSPNAFVLSGTTNANGKFDLPGAITGEYILTTGTPAGAGFLTVQVGGNDVEDLKLIVGRGSIYSGHVTIEGRPVSENSPELARIRVMIIPDMNFLGAPAVTTFNVGANGDFQYQGRRYTRIRVSGIPQNTYVKRIRVGSRELTGDETLTELGPLEIVIGTDTGLLGGTVINEKRVPLSNSTVVLVPDSPNLRSSIFPYRSDQSDDAGRFRLVNIPSGNYRLFAWEDVEPNAWQDPEFLRSQGTSGVAVRIETGVLRDIQVTAIAARR